MVWECPLEGRICAIDSFAVEDTSKHNNRPGEFTLTTLCCTSGEECWNSEAIRRGSWRRPWSSMGKCEV
jgi:hypothetical protein